MNLYIKNKGVKKEENNKSKKRRTIYFQFYQQTYQHKIF